MNVNGDMLEAEDTLAWTAFLERSLIGDLVRVGVGYAYYDYEALSGWWRGPERWKIGRRTSHRFCLVGKLGMIAMTGGASSWQNHSTGRTESGGLFLRWLVPWSKDGYFSLRGPVYVLGVGYFDRRLDLDESKSAQYGLDEDDWARIRRDNPSHQHGLFWILRLDIVEVNAKVPGWPIALLGSLGLELRPFLGGSVSAGLSF